MKKSATELMQEIVFAAAIDSIGALKTASKGLPNTLLRDLNAIHANTTFADLPPELQAAISASVRSAFARLMKEGYSVSPGQPTAAPAARPRPEAAGDRRPQRRPAPRSEAPRGERPPRDPNRQPRDPSRPPRDPNRPNRKPGPR
jgi:hypothetical protein